MVLALVGAGCDQPEEERPMWTLTETLRLGGADEGPLSFDRVKGIEADAQGRMFVYDQLTQDIRMFAADGSLLRVIGRAGAGPGELRNAEGIALASDGTLWVRDAANARFSIFSADGEFERVWSMQFCSSQGLWAPLADPSGRIVDSDCIVAGGRAVADAMLAYRTDLSGVDTVGTIPECGGQALAEAGTWITRTETSTRYRPIPFRAIGVSTLGSGNVQWCAPNSARYEIVGVPIGGGDTTRIVRNVPPLPVTAAERDSVIALYEVNGPSGLDFDRIPTVKPAIDRLTVDDQSRLWVRFTNAAGELEFDIYDAHGTLLAGAVLGRYQPSGWHPFVIRGDAMYAVVLGEDDLQHIVRFEIKQ
jgi:hypothetical protein